MWLLWILKILHGKNGEKHISMTFQMLMWNGLSYEIPGSMDQIKNR